MIGQYENIKDWLEVIKSSVDHDEYEVAETLVRIIRMCGPIILNRHQELKLKVDLGMAVDIEKQQLSELDTIMKEILGH